MSDIDVKPDTIAKPKIEQPRLYKVILLNDDYTPREFVIGVLMMVFHMSEDQAYRVMMTAHQRGACVVAAFTRDIAESKATEGTNAGRQNGHPLAFTTEPEEEDWEPGPGARAPLEIRPNRIRHRRKAIARQQRRQLVLDAPDDRRSLVDHHRVELHQGRAGADLGVGVGTRADAAATNQRELPLDAPGRAPHHLRRQGRERCAGQAAGLLPP